MNKKFLLPAALLIVLLIVISWLVLTRKNNSHSPEEQPNKIILFYGDGCPHCALVEEYIKENKTDEKISFEQKEVYSNRENAMELAQKAQICGISTDSIGVPFLWDGEKCLVGDEDIINFFKNKTN